MTKKQETEKTTEAPKTTTETPEKKAFNSFEPIDFSARKGREFVNNEYLESKQHPEQENTEKMSCPRCNGKWWEEKVVSMFRANTAVAPGGKVPPAATPEGLKGYPVYVCFECGFHLTPKMSGARPAYAMGAHARFAQVAEKKNESKE